MIMNIKCSLSLMEFQCGWRRLMRSRQPLSSPELCQQPSIASSKTLWWLSDNCPRDSLVTPLSCVVRENSPVVHLPIRCVESFLVMQLLGVTHVPVNYPHACIGLPRWPCNPFLGPLVPSGLDLLTPGRDLRYQV